MQFTIDLQDHEGVSHGDKKCTIDNKATVDQLEGEVASIFKIKPVDQQLFFNGVRLRYGTLQEAGIKDRDTVVVKHSDLQWWPLYRNHVESTLKSSKNRVDVAKRAVELHQRLMESGLFDVYASFEKFRMEKHHLAASWTDGLLEIMSKAVRDHFLVQHIQKGGTDASSMEYNYEGRSNDMAGSRKGIIVKVKLHGEEVATKYNVKCHHFGSSSLTAKSSFPDIKEIYLYKLLELIGVGPCAQFILPSECTGSWTSTHIATKWRNDFLPLSTISKEEEVNESALIQLQLLSLILFINDLHGDNCGQWRGANTAAIVDFIPKPYRVYQNVVRAIEDPSFGLQWDSNHLELLSNCQEKRRSEVFKESLKIWDLDTNLDLADVQIKEVKNKMKSQSIGFRGSKQVTEELDDYIKTIKENLQNFVVHLNSPDNC